MPKLISEIRRWHWAITWDNASPANSSTMLASLEKLGRVTMTQTKTTVLLAPNRTAGWRRIRKVIKANLHPTKGNAVYANLRSQKTFQWGSKTGHAWKKVA
jgi:hypothetical protein